MRFRGLSLPKRPLCMLRPWRRWHAAATILKHAVLCCLLIRAMYILLKPIRYLFYRLLTYKLRDARETTPVLVACLATTGLLLFNLMSATMVVSYLAGRQDLLPALGRWTLYAAIAVAAWLGYVAMRAAWVDNGNYARLVSEFQTRSQVRETLRAALFWSYLLLTIALPISLAIVLPHSSA